MNTSYNIQLHMARFPCCEFPLLVPFSTYLAPSSCDRNRPPQSQVARRLTLFVPHCPLVPFPPNSQPCLGFPELNVHLIRRHHKPSLQYTAQSPFVIRQFYYLHYYRLVLLILRGIASSASAAPMSMRGSGLLAAAAPRPP